MKLKSKLLIAVFLIVLQLACSMKKANLLTSLLKSNGNQVGGVVAVPPVESTTFWLIKFFPGKDPISYLEHSWYKPQKKYFVLNNSSIYYGRNELTKAIIEDTIDLKELYDKDADSAVEGRCCKRMKYLEFPEVQMCDGKPCNKLYPDGKITDEQRDSDPYMARYCLELWILNVAKWRICHRSKDEIQRLRMNVVMQTIKQQVAKVDSSVISKILMNSDYGPLKAPVAWNWMEQENWGGNCDSQLMQSPIPIKVDPTGVSVQPRFALKYGFPNRVPVAARKNQDEVVVDFLTTGTNNGYLQIQYGLYEVMIKEFNPYRMSFRFPAEHTIDENRYDGEILLQFKEKVDNDDSKMALLSGLNWAIPFKFDPNAKLIHELEQLMPDFWKFELEVNKEYRPLDVKSGKEQYFDLKELMDKVGALKTDFAIYLGSETTPPCSDYMFWVVNFKPLSIPNCQFKILRENTLITNRERETHARKLKENLLGGKAEIRRVTAGSLSNQKRPIVQKPEVPKTLDPAKPAPVQPPPQLVYPPSTPPTEVDKTPNCELTRDMARRR